MLPFHRADPAPGEARDRYEHRAAHTRCPRPQPDLAADRGERYPPRYRAQGRRRTPGDPRAASQIGTDVDDPGRRAGPGAGGEWQERKRHGPVDHTRAPGAVIWNTPSV